MQLYGGTLIHKSHDDLGVIEVVDEPHQRSLHFGTWARQSSILNHDPDRLALSYTRAMLAALLFRPSPERILLLGLGGGTMARFLLKHFPECHIDAVEYRQAVVEVAREYFRLPEEPRLTITIADAGHFIFTADPQRFGNYDLILVDAFLDYGIARSVCGQSFNDACRDRLVEGGVFSMNLWSGDFVTSRELLESIEWSFPGAVVQLPVEDRANVIAIARRGTPPKRDLKRLNERGSELQRELGIEFPTFIRQMRQANSRLSGLF